MNKKERQIVEKELKIYHKTIKYLIEIYCLNPNETITVKKIEEDLKINNSNILRPLITDLLKKEILKGSLGRYKITFNGFETLIKMKNNNRKLVASTITLAIVVITFLLTVLEDAFSATGTPYVLIYFIIGCITMNYINHFLDKYY